MNYGTQITIAERIHFSKICIINLGQNPHMFCVPRVILTKKTKEKRLASVFSIRAFFSPLLSYVILARIPLGNNPNCNFNAARGWGGDIS